MKPFRRSKNRIPMVGADRSFRSSTCVLNDSILDSATVGDGHVARLVCEHLNRVIGKLIRT